ncbi:MAG: ferritin, partial [Geobacter sp.]
MNVFDFAMRMEEESRQCYEKVAAAATTPYLRSIFGLLADSEREHYEHLATLKGGGGDQADSVALERLKDQVHDLLGNISHGDVLDSDPNGFRHVVKAEEASIKLYEKLADQEPDETVAGLLRQLADEERHHLEIMENIYDFVEAP